MKCLEDVLVEEIVAMLAICGILLSHSASTFQFCPWRDLIRQLPDAAIGVQL